MGFGSLCAVILLARLVDFLLQSPMSVQCCLRSVAAAVSYEIGWGYLLFAVVYDV